MPPHDRKPFFFSFSYKKNEITFYFTFLYSHASESKIRYFVGILIPAIKVLVKLEYLLLEPHFSIDQFSISWNLVFLFLVGSKCLYPATDLSYSFFFFSILTNPLTRLHIYDVICVSSQWNYLLKSMLDELGDQCMMHKFNTLRGLWEITPTKP